MMRMRTFMRGMIAPGFMPGAVLFAAHLSKRNSSICKMQSDPARCGFAVYRDMAV